MGDDGEIQGLVGRKKPYGNGDRVDTLHNRKYRMVFFSIQLVFSLDAPNYVYTLYGASTMCIA